MEGLITDEEQNNLVKEATVKIYAISNSPDYYSPWKMLEMDSGSGSGAIIEKNRVFDLPPLFVPSLKLEFVFIQIVGA